MSALEHIKEEEMGIAFDWAVFEMEGNGNLEEVRLLGEKFFTNEWNGSNWVGMLRVAGAPCGAVLQRFCAGWLGPIEPVWYS